MNTRLKSLIPFVTTALFAGTVLSVLAPYGTANLSAPLRFIYWVGLCLIGGIGVLIADYMLDKSQFSGAKITRAVWRSIGSSLGVFFALTLMMAFLGGLPDPGSALLLFFYIWVIGFTICFVATFIEKESTSPQKAKIYDRMKPGLRNAEIYALSAEDHYVRIITAKGDDLILMRLGDAISETKPLQGLSPHRSWWVAENGVDTLQKRGGKTTIALKNGIAVPVSRNGQKQVREAGWS